MQRRQRLSLAEALLVWGFVLSFVGLLGAGCFEAYKIVAVIPAAFESSPAILRNPMNASADYYQPDRSARRRLTPQQRAELEERERENQ